MTHGLRNEVRYLSFDFTNLDQHSFIVKFEVLTWQHLNLDQFKICVNNMKFNLNLISDLKMATIQRFLDIPGWKKELNQNGFILCKTRTCHMGFLSLKGKFEELIKKLVFKYCFKVYQKHLL